MKKNQTDITQELMDLGWLLYEKCELAKAQEIFLKALELYKQNKNISGVMESLSQLLRLAGESLNEQAIHSYESELKDLMDLYPKNIHPMVWYCKAIIESGKKEMKNFQRFLHQYIRLARSGEFSETHIGKGWAMMAVCLFERGFINRSEWLIRVLLHRYESKNLRSVNGVLYIVLGHIYEKRQKFEEALHYYQKSHASFLGEHNWYYHLYVLLAYARIARLQQNYTHAYFNLNLIEKATASSEFKKIKKEVVAEQKRLEQDAFDLLIDCRKGIVKTREAGQISLRKQYVLLGILEALSQVHAKEGLDSERGLSKAEIINKVWKENYQSRIHDNKLYYNINRIRKLIEPNAKEPQYLLNWKEGYRLAPSLRVRFVGIERKGR